MSPNTHPRQSKRGFTLVELMVVVTMIGILSVLAVMGIRRNVGYMKNMEAPRVVAAIKAAQAAYLATHGEYFDVSRGNLGDCYPYGSTSKLGKELRAWAQPAAVGARWDTLGVDVSGPVHFCYAVVAGIQGDAIPKPDADVPFGTPQPTGPWYVVQATGDPDKNGRLTVYVSSSFEEAIHHLQEDGVQP